MSEINTEIISLHRVQGHHLHNVGVDLYDEFQQFRSLDSEYQMRMGGIPVFNGVNRLGAPFVEERMAGSASPDIRKIWTGIEINIAALRPIPLGGVNVTSDVVLELGPRVGRKEKQPAMTVTVVDAYSFSENPEASALRLYAKGIEVARTLHPGTPIVTVEKTGPVKRRQVAQNTYLDTAKQAFKNDTPVFSGSIRRKSNIVSRMDFEGIIIGKQEMELVGDIWIPVTAD